MVTPLYLLCEGGEAAVGEGGCHIHTVLGRSPIIGGIMEGVARGCIKPGGFGPVHGEAGSCAEASNSEGERPEGH